MTEGRSGRTTRCGSSVLTSPMLNSWISTGILTDASLFVCLPAHFYILLSIHILVPPMQTNEETTRFTALWGASGWMVTHLSNLVWFWKYWICILTVMVGDDCKLSNHRRFQKYWIGKSLFHKRIPPSGIQLFKKEGLLDNCSEKFASEVRNTYPLF